MATPVLEISDIHQTYLVSQGLFQPKKPLHAVNGVSLSVAEGEVLGLVGESGSGKSTLANILLGLQRPTAGDVRIGNRPVEQLSRLEIARIVQPIFQDPYASLNPRKTVGSILALPLQVQKAPNRETWRKRIETTMDLVGLPKRVYNSFPSQMSGGQRQRVAIARALINHPKVVICDEPTSALDVSVQAQILNLLSDLREELGLTYVLISHNLAVVEHLATRVAVMYMGRLVEVADTRALFSAHRHPYTEALFDSVLTPDPALGIPDAQQESFFPNPLAPPSGCTFHPRCAKRLERCNTVAPQPVKTAEGIVECHLYKDLSA